MQPRAAIYCRISETDERFDKVANQEASCREYAKKRGYRVVKVFTDDGITASKFAHRPAYVAMIELVKAGKVDVIVATAQDRLSRQPREVMELSQVCVEHGVLWDTLRDGETDPATEMGEFLSFVRGWIGRNEQTAKADRLRARLDKQRSEGKPLWGVRPFAFEVNRIDHREYEAAELRWAYEQVLAGQSLYSIMREWNELGVLPSRQRDYLDRVDRGDQDVKSVNVNGWSYATVRQLLLRPRNAGLVENGRDEKTRKPVITDIKAKWDPVVSRDVWDMAGAILADPKRRKSQSTDRRWLVPGIAVCGVCGNTMRSATGSDRKDRFPIYRCSSRMRPARPAPASGAPTKKVRHPAVKAEDLDKLVAKAVVSSFLLGARRTTEASSPELEDVRQLQVRLAEVRVAIADLVSMIGTPGVTRATVAKRTAVLGAEEEQLEAELEEQRRRSAHAAMVMDAWSALYGRKDKRVPFEDAVKVKDQLHDRFESLSLEQQRTLVRSTLKITIQPWTREGTSMDRVQIEHLTVPDLDRVDES